MNAPTRRPGFLAAVPEHGDPRAPAFQNGRSAPPSRAGALPLRTPGRPQEPVGPTAEEMAALRAEALEKVAHAIEVLRLQSERLSEQARSDALEIGFLVARRVIEAELATSPEALFALVRGAVKKAGESRKVVVRVNPSQLALLEGAMATGSTGTAGVGAVKIELAGDPGLEPGDCVVDTDFGTVDGRLHTRLEELYRAARSALEEGAA